jgi:hypothetical protein
MILCFHYLNNPRLRVVGKPYLSDYGRIVRYSPSETFRMDCKAKQEEGG